VPSSEEILDRSRAKLIRCIEANSRCRDKWSTSYTTNQGAARGDADDANRH
jgi:hypothetical protein